MDTELRETFAAIRPLFARHAAKGLVLHDEPHRYYLGTPEVRAKDGYRTQLGGVEVKKNYVSAHLMPVYIYPDLVEENRSGASQADAGEILLQLQAA